MSYVLSEQRAHELRNFQNPFKYQMNQQSISLPQLHVTREERKRKTPYFRKNATFQSTGLSIIESEVDSQYFSELLNQKSQFTMLLSFARSIEQKFDTRRILSIQRKWQVSIWTCFNPQLYTVTPVFFSPLCCESLLQMMSALFLLHNIICLLFEHSTPTHPNPETQQHNIQSVLSTYETSGFQQQHIQLC